MDRRTFLRAGAASAAVILTPGLLMPVRKLIAAPAYLTATEVNAQMDAYLRRCQELIDANLRANPPLIAHPDGSFSQMLFPPDRQWFTLKTTR